MSAFEITVSGVSANEDHLLIGLQIKSEAWTRFATVKLPYSGLSDYQMRRINTFWTRRRNIISEEDSPMFEFTRNLAIRAMLDGGRGGAEE